MANLFGNNYLDSYTDPDVWGHPKLIIQTDNLTHVVLNNTEVINGGSFDLSNDLIVLDKSYILMRHYVEGAINKTIC